MGYAGVDFNSSGWGAMAGFSKQGTWTETLTAAQNCPMRS